MLSSSHGRSNKAAIAINAVKERGASAIKTEIGKLDKSQRFILGLLVAAQRGELPNCEDAALMLETIETQLNKHRTSSECQPFVFEDCIHCGGRESREKLTEVINLKVQIGSIYELLHVSKSEDIDAVGAWIESDDLPRAAGAIGLTVEEIQKQ